MSQNSKIASLRSSHKLVRRINGPYPPSRNGEKFLAAMRPVAGQLDIELVFDLTTPDKRPAGFTPQEF